MSEEKSKQIKIDLKIPDDQRLGVYANHMLVQFTPTEFQIYFTYIVPAGENSDKIDAEVVSKVNLSTELLPTIIRALEENYRMFLAARQQASKKKDKEND